ncbi:hypothetical protein [Acinetobacter sp. ANC 3791]|uniref:hypothetical protein n=1 Tax=Acinetobacter sp. ANC 3791 TaxID=2529836 RepID=UPI00103CB249|nr:hypothetical protein [Acinetobacter sp. ANC 3791]TCB82017.1 hypothetical protein E0H90_14275 [Acinetobacter sp. ANC 3791]
MNTVEHAKALKQLKELLGQKSQVQGLELAKVLRDIIALRQELGMNTSQAEEPSPVFTAIINGQKTFSIDTVREAIDEAEAHPAHSQLVPATQKLWDEYQGQKGFDDIYAGDAFDSWLRDGHFDQIALNELKIHPMAQQIRNAPITAKSVVLVQEAKDHHFKILMGQEIYEKAVKDESEFVPCIILREKEGFTDPLIKAFIQKHPHVAYDPQSFALALDETIADEAEQALPG